MKKCLFAAAVALALTVGAGDSAFARTKTAVSSTGQQAIASAFQVDAAEIAAFQADFSVASRHDRRVIKKEAKASFISLFSSPDFTSIIGTSRRGVLHRLAKQLVNLVFAGL